MKLHNPVESIIAAENDPLAGDFYAAVRYAIDHEAMFFHTFADLRKVIEPDMLNPEVFWVHGKALYKYADIVKIMKANLADQETSQ